MDQGLGLWDVPIDLRDCADSFKDASAAAEIRVGAAENPRAGPRDDHTAVAAAPVAALPAPACGAGVGRGGPAGRSATREIPRLGSQDHAVADAPPPVAGLQPYPGSPGRS